MYGIKLYVYHLLKYPTIVGFRQLRDIKIFEKLNKLNVKVSHLFK